MPEIGIITNPHSKLNKRNPERSQMLSYILGEKGELAKTQNLTELDEVVRRFQEKDVKILAINGGDGTISRTLSALIRTYGEKPLPKIALLRGGTINMLAQNLGIRGTPESLLFGLVRELGSGGAFPSVRQRCLEVNGQFGFLFGNGTISSFLETFYQNKTDAFGSLVLMARVIFSAIFGGGLARKILRDHIFSLQIDQHPPLMLHSIALIASTVQQMPLGPKFFPMVGPGSQAIQFMVMRLAARNAAFLIPFTALFSAARDDFAKSSILAKHIQISSKSALSYTLDGELFQIPPAGDLTISLGPEIEFVSMNAEDPN
jgi:diacylglycerol kinase (ATP)